jgi:hypothetical protein
VTEKIMRDLIVRLEDKFREQMNDYLDLCLRADCDMEEASNHMLGLLIKEAVIGMLACRMNRKDSLASVGLAYDLARPGIEKALKKARRA